MGGEVLGALAAAGNGPAGARWVGEERGGGGPPNKMPWQGEEGKEKGLGIGGVAGIWTVSFLDKIKVKL